MFDQYSLCNPQCSLFINLTRSIEVSQFARIGVFFTNSSLECLLRLVRTTRTLYLQRIGAGIQRLYTAQSKDEPNVSLMSKAPSLTPVISLFRSLVNPTVVCFKSPWNSYQGVL